MVKSFARWFVRWEIGWLLLLAPFLFFPTPMRSLSLLGIPLLWLLRWVAWGRVVPRTPLDWPLFFLLFMVGVSLWVTFDPLFSLPKVTGVLLGVAFFYALVSYVRWYGALWLPLAVLIVVSCSVAGVSILGMNWADKFAVFAPMVARLPQVIGALPGSPPAGFNPNSVAGALLFAFPLLVVILFRLTLEAGFGRQEPLVSSGKPSKVEWGGIEQNLPPRIGRNFWGAARRGLLYLLLLAALALVSGILVLTQSRGGYLGLLVGVGALLFLPRPRLLLLAIMMGGLLVGGVGWFEPDLLERYFSQNAALAGQTAAGVNSLQGRIEIWSRALYGMQDFPFTGMGMGTFRRVVPILYPLFTISPDTDIGHPHNHLLAAGVDLGIPGLIAYLALWLGAAAMCWQVWRTSPLELAQRAPRNEGGHRLRRANYRALALGLAAGMMAHFTWGVFDSNVLGSKAGFVFWLALGAIASLHEVVVGRERR